MFDKERLDESLRNFPDGMIVLIETNADESFETSIALVDYFSKINDKGIIISANRPYTNLISFYKKNGIDVDKIFVLDLISKSQHADIKADNVFYIDNASSLTNISLALDDNIKKFSGKKFVFIDSITTMLIHNDPSVFARFIHNIFTKFRINEVDCFIITLEDITNIETRSEIAQLCDKVIKLD